MLCSVDDEVESKSKVKREVNDGGKGREINNNNIFYTYLII